MQWGGNTPGFRQLTGAAFDSSNGSQNPIPTKQRSQPQGAVQWSHILVLASANAVQLCPAFRVPPGCTVRVRANNGRTGGNTGMVFVARNRETCNASQGTPLFPLDDIAFPVDSTGEIWAIAAVANDGVVVSVISQSIA